MLASVKVKGDIHVGYLGLVRSILDKIAAEHRPAIMRMIDKKERETLQGYLQEIGADHLGLLELIDLKGKDALQKASEIALDLDKVAAPPAAAAAIGPAPVGWASLRAHRPGGDCGAEIG